MSSYSFSNAAVQDFDDICSYIAQSNSSTASQLFDAIRQKCKLVAGFLNMGESYEKLSSNLRGFTVNDCIIFYYPSEDEIVVALWILIILAGTAVIVWGAELFAEHSLKILNAAQLHIPLLLMLASLVLVTGLAMPKGVLGKWSGGILLAMYPLVIFAMLYL